MYTFRAKARLSTISPTAGSSIDRAFSVDLLQKRTKIVSRFCQPRWRVVVGRRDFFSLVRLFGTRTTVQRVITMLNEVCSLTFSRFLASRRKWYVACGLQALDVLFG